MDKDFTIPEQTLWGDYKDDPSAQHRYRKMLKFLETEIQPKDKILDVGSYNPFTEIIHEKYGILCESTYGDLDRNFKMLSWQYDFIICADVIEHVFDPYHLLFTLFLHLKRNGKLFISTPIHPYFLGMGPGHFHEMDRYRFEKLIKRANFEIIRYETYFPYNTHHPKNLIGLRPFLRMFHRSRALIICKKGGG